MTKAEAETLKAAARKWVDCACERELSMVLNQDNESPFELSQQELAFHALLTSMTEDTEMTILELQIAADGDEEIKAVEDAADLARSAAEYAETTQALANQAAEYARYAARAAAAYAARASLDAFLYAQAVEIAAAAYAEDTKVTARDAVKYADYAAKSAERFPTEKP